MHFDEDYEVGQQPCQNLKRGPGNIAAAPELANVHECYRRCGRTVSFCENCRRDHHEGGYEACIPITHGVNCPKSPHVGGGYLHSEGDDTPYDVDGCTYCGRCHRSL